MLQGGLGGSRALQKDLALAVANAHCAAAEKVRRWHHAADLLLDYMMCVVNQARWG